MSRIYLSAPDVRSAERALLTDAVDSNWIAPVGPDLDAFEQEVAAVVGVPHAVGLASGTAALHLGLMGLGVGAGDTVILPTLTFAACANAIAYLGATPVFIDVDPRTWNLSPELLESELRGRAANGSLPSAAVVVDLYGQCADYDEIIPILEPYNIPILEDAAEALGATYRGQAAGSFGRAAVLSFNGNKIITTSGGGMLLTDDADLAARVRYLSTQARQPVVHYEHTEVGYNYRLSNLLAAFGRGQLSTLPERMTRRRQVNQRYRGALSTIDGIEFAPVAEYGTPNNWLTCITLEADRIGLSPEALRLALEEDDIESRPIWKPLHLQVAFAAAPSRLDGTSEDLFQRGLCLPSGSGLTDTEVQRVIDRIIGAIARA